MPIKSYSTRVNSEKTVAQINKILAKAGARRIGMDYDEYQQPIKIHFLIQYEKNNIFLRYSIACNWEGVLRVMTKQKVKNEYLKPSQARDVAWRHIKDWIEAQMAFVESGAVDWDQLLLANTITNTGKTVYEEMKPLLEKGDLVLSLPA